MLFFYVENFFNEKALVNYVCVLIIMKVLYKYSIIVDFFGHITSTLLRYLTFTKNSVRHKNLKLF
jgi:hypothetical protein